jgi:eukaryotic-like serine/threonine-protein kinase
MPELNVFSDEDVIAAATIIASATSKSELQQLLIDSRLLPRNTPRDELRKKCPSPAAWLKLLRDHLPIPNTRSAAFRALGGLIIAYLGNPTLDQRVETSLRKARQAADRSDMERLTREIQKLGDLALELEQPELYKPAILVYLAVGSERGRDFVAQAVTDSKETQPVVALVQQPSHAAQSEPTVALAREADAVHSSVAEVLSTLSAIGSAETTRLQWNVASLASTRVSRSEVNWPILDGLSKAIRDLTESCNKQLEFLSSFRPSAALLPEFAARLKQLGVTTSNVLDAVNCETERLIVEIRGKCDSYLNEVTSDLQDEVGKLREQLVSSQAQLPIEEVESLLVRSRTLVERKITDMLATTDKLCLLAAYLSEDSQRAVEMKSRHLVLNFKQEELNRLLQETETRTEEPRRLRDRTKAAAIEVADFLKGAAGLRLDALQSERIIEAVKEGDAPKAVASVSYSPEPSVVVPLRNEVVSARPPEYPPEILESPTLLTVAPLEVGMAGFTPRDRVLAKDPALPRTSAELANFLFSRIVVEIERGSQAAAIDTALDILQLAAGASAGRDYWANVALVVLAALPSTSSEDSNWSGKTARALTDSIKNLDSNTLVNYFAALLTQVRCDEAISTRFDHPEIAPFVGTVSRSLYRAVVTHKPYLLEDVSRALGAGAAFGDVGTAQSMLLALATASSQTEEVHGQLQLLLTEHSRRLSARKPQLPEWLLEGVTAFSAAVDERNQQLIRGTSRSSVVRVGVPRSVSLSGGFAVIPGADEVEFALLVSNHQNRSLSGLEVAALRPRNPWLAEDIVSVIGVVGVNEQRLVHMRAKLVRELPEHGRLEVGLAIRYREPGNHEPRYDDIRTEIKLVHNPSLAIQSYEGAGGKPLILEGDALKYSSNSVKKALSEISNGLLAKGIAALVIGRRRRGKTSILQTISQHRDIRNRYTVITDSWEDLPSRSITTTLRRLGNIFDRAARNLNVGIDSLERRVELDVGAGWSVIQQWIDDLTTKLPSQTRLLLLIDEFQKWISLLDSESRARILYILRGLFNRPEAGRFSVSIILSGLSNIREFTRASADFENAFQVFNIEAFNLSEVDSLIRSNPTIEFDTRAVTQMRHLAGGNPFLINLLGNDIAARLREKGRAYCLPEDVGRVVRAQLDDKENSRVWSFLQYLLKEGEEDHAAQIPEFPALLALAYAFRMRGAGRRMISVEEIASEMETARVECNREMLVAHLQSAVRNELLSQMGLRFAFANGWLAEWLGVSENLLPITPKPDEDLVLGRFKLIQFLDRGGQASIYEAQDTRAFNRPVIVKIYPRTQAGGLSTSVMKEAKLLHSIEHTGVVTCVEFGPDPNKGDVIVLERVKGDTLRQLLVSRPKHAIDLLGAEGNLKVQVKLIEQIASALAECHRVGVVHKDLKPENIIVQANAGIWSPKIIDFGLATNINESGADVRTVGSYTPGYVAPERYRGEGRRAPADIYSLGVVAYELLTGAAPFPTDSLLAREAQESGRFVQAKERRPEIPLRLSELIAEMMSPDPLKRPNAFTLLGKLSAALHTSDWIAELESGKRSYSEGDAETAFDYLERAAFGAPEDGRRSSQYIEALDYLVDTADTCGKVLSVAPEIIQPIAVAALVNDKAVSAFESLITKVVKDPVPDPKRRDAQRTAIHTLIQLLVDTRPCKQLAKAVELLLGSGELAAVWADREDIFLIGLGYKDANLLGLGLITNWCLNASRKLRERDATLLHAQIWLRRAERIGVSRSSEYIKENEALEKLLRRTATPQLLPSIPESQDSVSRAVGDDEQGHLNVALAVRRILMTGGELCGMTNGSKPLGL